MLLRAVQDDFAGRLRLLRVSVQDTITWRLFFGVGLVVPCQALLDLAEAAVDGSGHDLAYSPAEPVLPVRLDFDLVAIGTL